MGRKQRNRERAADLRKQVGDKKQPFVDRKVSELRAMDAEILRLMEGRK